MIDMHITITKPYRGVIADVPAQVIVASMPEFALPLIRNVEAKALSMARLRRAPDRLRFVEAKLGINGLKLTIIPKGRLPHLLDAGAGPHSLEPGTGRGSRKNKYYAGQNPRGILKIPGVGYRYANGWEHPGVRGRRFMPAALQASQPEMRRILDRNTVTYLAKVEHP